MFDVLVYLYENYWRPDACPDQQQLKRKLSAVGFDYQRIGEKFRQMFPFILALDQLWAIAPFLLIQEIGLGAAFAVCAALLYLPFSERTLIRMAYIGSWVRT